MLLYSLLYIKFLLGPEKGSFYALSCAAIMQLDKMDDAKKEQDTGVIHEEGILSNEVAAEGVLNGALDPAYEAKAHVLNNAVSGHSSTVIVRRAPFNMVDRSKTLAWDGISGNCSWLSGSGTHPTTCGLSSLR